MFSYYHFSLYALVEKPPVGGREFMSLSDLSLLSFRLMPGSVSTVYIQGKFPHLNFPEIFQFKFSNRTMLTLSGCLF